MGAIDTDAVRGFADQFETEVAAKLTAAQNLLKGADGISYSNFTNLHPPLAIVYVEAINFQQADLFKKEENATEIRRNLRASADGWDAAEQASTIHPDGPN